MTTYTEDQMADLARRLCELACRLCETAVGSHEREKALQARIEKLEGFFRELLPDGAPAWKNEAVRRMIDKVMK